MILEVHPRTSRLEKGDNYLFFFSGNKFMEIAFYFFFFYTCRYFLLLFLFDLHSRFFRFNPYLPDISFLTVFVSPTLILYFRIIFLFLSCVILSHSHIYFSRHAIFRPTFFPAALSQTCLFRLYIFCLHLVFVFPHFITIVYFSNLYTLSNHLNALYPRH